MRFEGLVYRAHHPAWAFSPLSGEGARRHGGRFNPVGEPALYTSLRFETAWLEAQQGFVLKAQPMTLCAYRVDCEDVCDLTDAAERDRLGIAPDDLSDAWEVAMHARREPRSWAIARRLMQDGVAGIVVPSFARGARERDRNLVFWRWSSSLPHRLELIDHEARLSTP